LVLQQLLLLLVLLLAAPCWLLLLAAPPVLADWLAGVPLPTCRPLTFCKMLLHLVWMSTMFSEPSIKSLQVAEHTQASLLGGPPVIANSMDS
jgi:hypothetical protein